MNEYDDPESIARSLCSLEAFDAIVTARHHAVYCHLQKKNRVPLHDWVIAGKWLTTSTGNTGRLVRFDVDKSTEIPDDIPTVMDWETFTRQFGSYYMEDSFFGLPPAGSICGTCREPWTIENCHLAQAVEYEDENPAWRSFPRYVGILYEDIPRATVLNGGREIYIKPTTLIVRRSRVRTIHTAERDGLRYNRYTLLETDSLPYKLVTYVHRDKTCPVK